MSLPKDSFFIRIFRVLNTVQSFIFKVQFVAFVLSSNSFIISECCELVKHFFKKFFEAFPLLCCSSATLVVYHVVSVLSTTFLSYLFCCLALLLQWYILYHVFSGLSTILFHFFIFFRTGTAAHEPSDSMHNNCTGGFCRFRMQNISKIHRQKYKYTVAYLWTVAEVIHHRQFRTFINSQLNRLCS